MAPPSDNIWVGDLPLGMDQGTLSSTFESYGQIMETRMLPGKDPAAKPAAMIRFASVEMATWVVENLNGNIPEGLNEPIVCRFANANYDKGGKGKGGDAGGWGKAKGGDSWGGAGAGPYGGAKGGAKGGDTPGDNVWVGDLPLGSDKPDLARIFEPYGQITDCRMLPGRDASAKPCAMIRFASVDMAKWVVENLNGNIPEGCNEPIIARYANSGGGGKGGGKDAGKGGGMDAWGGGKDAFGGGGWGGGKDFGKGAQKGGKDFGGGKGGGKGAPGSFNGLFQSVKGSGILGGGTVPDECQCFVKNLPMDTTDFELYKLFSPFGAIPPTGVKAMMNPDGTCKGIGFVDFTDPSAAQTAAASLDGFAMPDGTALGCNLKKPGKGGAKGAGKKGKN